MMEFTDGGAFGPLPIGTVYGVILNSRRQRSDLGDRLKAAPYGASPRAPVLYIKPCNTFAEDGAEVVAPDGIEALDVAGTLGAVVGRTICRAGAEEALAGVAGYTVAIDISLPHTAWHRPAIRQRCRDGYLPIASCIAPAAAVPDPDALTVTMTVGGRAETALQTAELVRPVGRLLSDLSQFMTLSPGDLVLVGLPPQLILAKPDDTVEASAEGIGRIGCRIISEGPPA